MKRAHIVKMAAAAIAVAAAMPTGPAAQDGQPRSGGQAQAMQCIPCHGPAGISQNPMFPHLAGQQALYLENQLENFKSGERYHPLMTPVAQSLSRAEIVDLAAYFSSVGPLAAAGRSASQQ